MASKCAAPACSNPKLEQSWHCLNHSKVFKGRYKKYKKLESRLKALNPKSESIKELLIYRSLLEDIYTERTKYRKLAFSTELWDEGHAYKIETIVKQLEDNEKELEMFISTAISLVEEGKGEKAISNINRSENISYILDIENCSILDAEEADSSIHSIEIQEKRSTLIDSQKRLLAKEAEIWSTFVPNMIGENIIQKKLLDDEKIIRNGLIADLNRMGNSNLQLLIKYFYYSDVNLLAQFHHLIIFNIQSAYDERFRRYKIGNLVGNSLIKGVTKKTLSRGWNSKNKSLDFLKNRLIRAEFVNKMLTYPYIIDYIIDSYVSDEMKCFTWARKSKRCCSYHIDTLMSFIPKGKVFVSL